MSDSGTNDDHGSRPDGSGRPKMAASPAAARRALTQSEAEGLAHLPLLADVDDDVLKRLAGKAEAVELPAADWLFRAGAEADCAYLLLTGRLEVIQDGELVNQLTHGAVLGELALLTSAPRSASVRARRDSTLLRLTREDFEAIAAAEPGMMRAVAAGLAAQLQRRPSMPLMPAPPSVIAVVAVDDDACAAHIGGRLVQAIARHLRVLDPGRVDANGLGRAEQDWDRVVVTAENHDGQWRDFCLRCADRVVLVAGRPSPPPGGPVHPAETGADLVLDGEVSRGQLVAWHDAYEPRSSCVLRGTAGLASGLLSLGARVSGRSIGLTLGGGGARAFAHIGVLEELDARGIQVDRVSGSSMGALIGALYARGLGADAIYAAVYEAFVRGNPLSDYMVPRQSLSRGRKTMRELERAFGGELIEELAKEFRCVSVDLLRRTPVVHARGRVVDAVAASLRVPGLFAPYPLNGSLHIDGGVLDNLPVRALRTGEGPVIAVSIPSAIARDAGGPQGAAPQIPGLVETLLRVMMLSSENAAEAARADADLVITPDTSGFGLRDFRRVDLIREAGRTAARAALASAASEAMLGRGPAQPM